MYRETVHKTFTHNIETVQKILKKSGHIQKQYRESTENAGDTCRKNTEQVQTKYNANIEKEF